MLASIDLLKFWWKKIPSFFLQIYQLKVRCEQEIWGMLEFLLIDIRKCEFLGKCELIIVGYFSWIRGPWLLIVNLLNYDLVTEQLKLINIRNRLIRFSKTTNICICKATSCFLPYVWLLLAHSTCISDI